MTNELPHTPPDELAPVRSPAGLRRWFLAGFALVFVGMLVFVKQFAWHPSGEVIVRYTLWQYYVVECRRALTSTGVLGPTSGSGFAAVVVFVEHVAISVGGGAISLVAGVIVHRLRR